MLHPTHQGLADPPISFNETLYKKMEDMDHSSQNITSIIEVQVSESIKDKKYQDNFDVNALLGDKTSVSRVALQRCLGRWSNTTLFLSKVLFF